MHPPATVCIEFEFVPITQVVHDDAEGADQYPALQGKQKPIPEEEKVPAAQAIQTDTIGNDTVPATQFTQASNVAF